MEKKKLSSEVLLADGFWYCGKSESASAPLRERFYVIEELTEPVGDWLLGFACSRVRNRR